MSGWAVCFCGLTVKGFAEALSAACSGYQDFGELSARFMSGHGKVFALGGGTFELSLELGPHPFWEGHNNIRTLKTLQSLAMMHTDATAHAKLEDTGHTAQDAQQGLTALHRH